MSARRILGFIVDWPELGPYQRDLVRGAHRAAVRWDANLLVLPSTILYAENRAFADWSLGQTTGPLLDGLVLATATFQDGHGSRELESWLAPWAERPVVSIGETLPGRPSLLLENGDSFAHLLDHLFGHHGYQRPAFVGGPEESLDARERLAVFLEALRRHELAADAVLPGNFQFDGGKRAVAHLVTRGAPFPDVIVCANDNLALGVWYALRERGMRIPEDVAVTGFDDIEFSPWIESPFTTVRQPTVEMAERAVAVALGRGDSSQRLATSLVIRGSCGCPTPPPQDPVGQHLANQMAQYSRDDAAHTLDGLIAEFSARFQEEGRLDNLASVEVRMLQALELDWWYLCHADPQDSESRPSRLHLVHRDGTTVNRDVASTPRFPGGLGLEGRWTALQIDLTVGPRGRKNFAALLVPYWDGFRQRYELIRSRLSEAVGSMETTQRFQQLNVALQEAGRRLEDLSMTDELTGCPNRRGFLTFATRELITSRRHGHGLWVVFIDLDGLKTINDGWGHQAGDEAIRTFARVLSQSVRSSDLMARLGGDEFTLLVSHSDRGTLDRLRHRIDQGVARVNASLSAGWQLSYCLGAVFSPPSEGRGLEELMGDADKRLYLEKQQRRM